MVVGAGTAGAFGVIAVMVVPPLPPLPNDPGRAPRAPGMVTSPEMTTIVFCGRRYFCWSATTSSRVTPAIVVDVAKRVLYGPSPPYNRLHMIMTACEIGGNRSRRGATWFLTRITPA